MPSIDFPSLLQKIHPGARLLEAIGIGSGGSMHSAYRLCSEAGSFFVKINTPATYAQLLAEADGITRLAATECLRLPKVLSHGSNDDLAWLALEWLELKPLDKEGGRLLAQQLAKVHEYTDENFGLPIDNYLGNSLQCNAQQRQWPYFFAQARLQPQMEAAKRNGLDRQHYDAGMLLAEKLPAFFVDRRVKPSLLHGDLWSGNAAMLEDGTPVVFDPAVYYGDAETDLAMAELFGGFPESFYAEYRRSHPLAYGYEQRKTLYNLYHLLNHFNLFGPSYLAQVTRMIDTLAAELRR